MRQHVSHLVQQVEAQRVGRDGTWRELRRSVIDADSPRSATSSPSVPAASVGSPVTASRTRSGTVSPNGARQLADRFEQESAAADALGDRLRVDAERVAEQAALSAKADRLDRDLADLLEKICLAWPVPVSDISLVGHSMGGLVARSAVATARSSGHGWVDLTRSLVAVAAPHFGSPIEKGVHTVSRSLARFKESQPLGAFLDQRSAGIKSLRRGIDVAENEEAGALRYFVVAGAVTADVGHPLGKLVGDLVVRVGSATGKSRRLMMQSSDALIVGGRNHADLVHDAKVITQIRTWLTPNS